MNTLKKEKLSTRTPSIGISMLGDKNSISIGKDVIRLLGYPSHICIKINKTGDRILILPCAANENMSFKVPDKLFLDHNCIFRVHSKQFVKQLMQANGMNSNLTYTIPGVYSEENNAALFKLPESRLYESQRLQTAAFN